MARLLPESNKSSASSRSSYWTSRPWFLLLQGLPAVICLMAVVLALVIVRRPYANELISRYEAAAKGSQDREQSAAEDLCRRRLLELRPNDRKVSYDYAAMLGRRGEIGRATGIMLSIAPLDRSGYAPAHFWLAEQMTQTASPQSPANTDLLQQRLEFALVGMDAVPAAHLGLVDLAMKARKWSVASEHLEVLVANRPDLLMTLAQAYREQNNVPKANSTSDRAAAYYSGLVRANPHDDASRLQWVKALVFQRQLKRAMDVLQSAENAGTDPRYGAAMAQLFVLRMAEIKVNSPARPGPADALRPANLPATALEVASRIELLAQAVHYAPNHPGVLAAVAQLSIEESPEGEQARSWLKDCLALGKGTATVHLILGTAAASKGELAQATFHLEQARQRDPSQIEAANNLAYVLARTEPPRTDEALQLLDAILKTTPNHPRIRETRGQILLMNGRYQEAILELEYVVEKLPRHVEAHTGLATAYESLGDRELADRHRRIAESLRTGESKSKKR